MQAQAFDVCVRGAGAVGMSLALALSRQGLQVALVQPGPAPGQAAQPARPDVRAYALNAASRALLARLKVWDALPADAVTPVLDMKVHGDAAGSAIHFSAWTQAVDALAWIVDAAELEAVLRAALRFAPHVQLTTQEPAAPLRVLAEGKHSPTREQLGVAMDRQPYRSEERRVGKECRRLCRSRWSPYH
jgi:2-polyprenyl-6-methoxyphenol hydroxylase-like FAD-dependent oxidoreductase